VSAAASFTDLASTASAGFAVEGAFAFSGGGASSTSSFGVAVIVLVTGEVGRG
jgi:hypothetical protein